MKVNEYEGADDRASYPEGDDGRFDLKALILLWADRDVLYAQSDRALTQPQIVAVRQYRLREAGELRPSERGIAGMKALTWMPPQHGQGTGRDDEGNVPGIAGWR
jgi:hypothetical protein